MLESGFQNDSMLLPAGWTSTRSTPCARPSSRLWKWGEFLDDEMRERLEQMQADGTMEELIERLIERMQQEELISVDQAA